MNDPTERRDRETGGRGDTAKRRTDMGNIRSYKELRVYQAAMDSAMKIFELSKVFPVDERFSLTDQIRRASRSVCTNIAEAWRKRPYPAHFASDVNDAETEADETRVWLEIASRCGYLREGQVNELDEAYDKIIAQLVRMRSEPDDWTIR